jgi:hypothetical protein
MDQVSRPVQIVLAVTLLFAALWFVALRPKSSAGGESASAPTPAAQTTPAPSSGAAPGTEGLKGAVDKANGAVATANADAERAAQSSADGSAAASSSAPAASGARPAAVANTARRAAAGSAGATSAHQAAGSPQVRAVKSALRHHKAVAIAFVDPNTADARAVAQEVQHVSHFGGRAVTLAVPLAKLSDYDFITNKVEVTVAPTVVIVDPRRRATTIVGFADRGEIEQRLADALAVKRRR